jgi:hypothetical protein
MHDDTQKEIPGGNAEKEGKGKTRKEDMKS